MDTTRLSDETFTFMVGMSTHSSAVPDNGMKVTLRILTEEDIHPEFDITPSTVRNQNRVDQSNYRRFGILPARLFDGTTRIIRLKNRAIAWLGIKLGGKDTSKMYSTNQKSNEHTVLCLRCDMTLHFTRLGRIHESMVDHEINCTGRNFCNKCFTFYSGSFGIRGSTRCIHEKHCPVESAFQTRIDWLADPIHRSVNRTQVNKYGFDHGGYETNQRAFSTAECSKMSEWIANFLKNTHDTPRYQRLIAAINSNIAFHGKEQIENKSPVIAVLFEVLQGLPLTLPSFAFDESSKNDAFWVNIPYRIRSFVR